MVRSLVLAALMLAAAAPALAAEAIGVITELHVKSGRVDLQPAAGGEWQAARPLQAIHAGDQVRAAGGARAVIVFVGSQRSTVVNEDSSPLTAAPPSQAGVGERVKSALSFLQATPRDRRVQAATRSAKGGALSSLVLVMPRETLVAPDDITLEWSGSQTQRYTARILSADRRVLWERKNLDGTALALPARDMRLAPGRYRWELVGKGQAAQSAPFDVATDEVAQRVKAVVEAVDAGRYPPATAALLRASGLMNERFHADARRQLLAAIAAHPDEPTLRLLLSNLYERTGLGNLADAEFDRAETLSGKR